MLNLDKFIGMLETHTPEQAFRSCQQDALVSCRIIAMQKWRTNGNGEWRAACLSITKAIKILEGEQDEDDGD